MLFKILEMLKTAPDRQMNDYWLKQCREFLGTEEELMELFEAIYNTNSLETSKFVRTIVNPKYTRGYMSKNQEGDKDD